MASSLADCTRQTPSLPQWETVRGRSWLSEEQAVEAASVQALLPAGKALLQLHKGQGLQVPLFLAGLLVQHDLLKLEHHGKLTAVRVAVQPGTGNIRTPGLAHRDQAAFLEGLGAQFPQKLMQAGSVGGDAVVRVLGDLVNDIQAETLHAPVHPPQDHVVQFPAQTGGYPS